MAPSTEMELQNLSNPTPLGNTELPPEAPHIVQPVDDLPVLPSHSQNVESSLQLGVLNVPGLLRNDMYQRQLNGFSLTASNWRGCLDTLTLYYIILHYILILDS